MTHTAPPGPGPGPTSGPTPEDPTPCPEGAEAPHAYLPIGEHGIIGDLRTAALVGTDGRIDWFCAPRFDSPSLFGGLLDAEKGGSWRIDPLCAVASRQQFYFPDTNILVTRMLTEDGIVEVQDFMPVLRPRDPHHQQRLVRRVTAVRGRMRMRSVVAPRMDYGRAPHRLTLDGDLAEFTGEYLVVSVRSGLPWQQAGPEGRDAETAFALKEGESVLFVLQTRDPGEERPREGITAERAEDLFRATATFWRNWLAHSTYTGRWREMVHRSALTLKLLTHEPTGALVAAPTLGLPEELGGVRNWDYRYVWIRDAAFSSTPCCVWASPTRPRRSSTGSPAPSATARTAARARCASSTPSTAAPTCPRRSCPTWRATGAPPPYASATAPTASSSSTSTGNSSTPPTCSTSTATASRGRPGRTW